MSITDTVNWKENFFNIKSIFRNYPFYSKNFKQTNIIALVYLFSKYSKIIRTYYKTPTKKVLRENI